MNGFPCPDSVIKQHFLDGMHLRSVLQTAFFTATLLFFSAIAGGFVYYTFEHGNPPDIMLNHLREADGLAQQGDYPAATVAYRKAAAVAPDDLEALLRLNRVALLSSDDSNRWWSLTRAHRAGPSDPRVNLLLGDAYLAESRFEKARQHYTLAIQLGPEVSYKLGYVALQLEDKDAARHWFQYTLSLNPAHQNARYLLNTIEVN